MGCCLANRGRRQRCPLQANRHLTRRRGIMRFYLKKRVKRWMYAEPPDSARGFTGRFLRHYFELSCVSLVVEELETIGSHLEAKQRELSEPIDDGLEIAFG